MTRLLEKTTCAGCREYRGEALTILSSYPLIFLSQAANLPLAIEKLATAQAAEFTFCVSLPGSIQWRKTARRCLAEL